MRRSSPARRADVRELDERANRAANHLLGLGLEPGAKVAIYGWNRAEWVESFFGARWARLVPININYRYVADELRYVFENADVEAVVVERSFLFWSARSSPSPAAATRHRAR